MYETILFDGTDIKTAGVRSIQVWDGVLLTTALRGADLLIPGADGEHSIPRPFGAGVLNLGLVLTTDTNAGFNDAYRALRRLAKVDGTVTLTRRLSFGTGNEEHTAVAKYAGGLEPTMVKMIGGSLTLSMKILGGLWYGPAVTIGAGTSTVAGDVRTRRMTVTFTGGTNPTLTNTTTGDVLTYTGSPTSAVVNVESMSAADGGTDVSGLIGWTPNTYPMTLAAGSNTLVLTGGGSVSVAYQPAYE